MQYVGRPLVSEEQIVLQQLRLTVDEAVVSKHFTQTHHESDEQKTFDDHLQGFVAQHVLEKGVKTNNLTKDFKKIHSKKVGGNPVCMEKKEGIF